MRNGITIYERMAVLMNEQWDVFNLLTSKEAAAILNEEFGTRTHPATIHTIMMGIRGTKRFNQIV